MLVERCADRAANERGSPVSINQSFTKNPAADRPPEQTRVRANEGGESLRLLVKPTGGSTMSRGRASVGAAHRITDDSELLTRTSWVDAGIAYRQVSKGRAFGNRRALWLRWHLQTHLYNLGCFTEKHCGKVLFLGLLLLSLCCVGLKTASLETNVERLWVEAGGRLQKEIKYTQDVRGEGSGITFEMIIQTPKTGHNNLLSVNSLLRHYEALRAATKITVDMYGITWTFKDLCFTSNFPSFDNNMFDRILNNIVPCTIITPLDCFWEGSKLLGPSHGIFVPGYHPSVKWTNLNPLELVRSLKKLGSYFPSDAIEDVLKRAGIGAAYQDRPCLNPSDMECPSTAPNRKSKLVS
ncbi:hypothetical protein LSAT2_018506 [Lamellibrachia satsuma]|nr:hypothetical protein LSAT2_018506 [Lamellibrachia satsuma]